MRHQSLRFWWLLALICSVVHIRSSSSLMMPRHAAFVSKVTNMWKDMEQSMKKSLKMTSLDRQITETNIESLIEEGPIPSSERQYLINGWRWHTLSVLRDLDRFKAIISRIKSSGIPLSQENTKLLNQCCNFVIGFNWKALLRVESEIFFPWLNDLLPKSAASLFQSISAKQTTIRSLSSRIHDISKSLEEMVVKQNKVLSVSETNEKLYDMEEILVELTSCAKHIQYIQETVFVPYIAAYVSTKEQEKFNRMVISRLGILDSQVHLVSMAEAIQQQPKEMKKFQTQIPKFAQVLIPVWKSRLYNPRTACLEGRGLLEDVESK